MSVSYTEDAKLVIFIHDWHIVGVHIIIVILVLPKGNANRFDSHGACMKTCLGVASETLPKTVSSDYVVDWEALQDLSNEII